MAYVAAFSARLNSWLVGWMHLSFWWDYKNFKKIPKGLQEKNKEHWHFIEQPTNQPTKCHVGSVSRTGLTWLQFHPKDRHIGRVGERSCPFKGTGSSRWWVGYLFCGWWGKGWEATPWKSFEREN